MIQPGRKFSAAGGYRYGFNGKENDNEVKGEGNQQDYGMRIYDPRLGRFLSVDPITKNFPMLTPYQFAGNKTVAFVDLDGLEDHYYMLEFSITGDGKLKIVGFKELEELRAGSREGAFGKYDIPVGELGQGNLVYLSITYNKNPETVVTETAFSFFMPKPKTFWQKVGDILRGGGGGIVFYAEQGQGKETRQCINCDGQMEEISGLIDLFLNQKDISTGLFKRSAPKGFLNEFTEYLNKIKKYVKGAEGLITRIEKIENQIDRTKAKKAKEESLSDEKTEKVNHVYLGYKKGTILHTNTGNVRVDSDSTGTCCQDNKKATDTVPSMKKNKE
jgi:RHS repeat-associated protein